MLINLIPLTDEIVKIFLIIHKLTKKIQGLRCYRAELNVLCYIAFRWTKKPDEKIDKTIDIHEYLSGESLEEKD